MKYQGYGECALCGEYLDINKEKVCQGCWEVDGDEAEVEEGANEVE